MPSTDSSKELEDELDKIFDGYNGLIDSDYQGVANDPAFSISYTKPLKGEKQDE